MNLDVIQNNIEIEQETIKILESKSDFLDSDASIGEQVKEKRRLDIYEQVLRCRKNISRLEAQALKAQQIEAREGAREEKQAMLASLYQEYCEYIKNHNLFYVQIDNAYTEYLEDQDKWLTFKTSSMMNVLPTLFDYDNRELFLKAIVELGRDYKNSTYTFNKTPTYTLNRLNKNIWIKPDFDNVGEVSEWFDLLMYSLGGGRRENITHIEQVLYWKYQHPEEYQLPCMVIYGNGGVGKNLLTDKLLKTLFSPNQAVTITMDDVTGNFNDRIAGKTVIYIDEAVAEKSDMNSLKNIVSNPYVTINGKFIQPYEADNTALYITGGNSLNGAIRLGDDDSDRRWSIIRARDSFLTHVMKKLDVDSDRAKAMISGAVESVFTNPNEVAKWIAHLIEKHKSMESAPSALHGDDFRELLSKQSGPFRTVMESVFNDPAFTYISAKTLWLLYQKIHRDEAPTGNVGGKSLFESRVDAWLAKHKPGILHNKSINIMATSTKSSTTSGYYDTSLKGRHKNTDSRYTSVDGGYSLPESDQSHLSVVSDGNKSGRRSLIDLVKV